MNSAGAGWWETFKAGLDPPRQAYDAAVVEEAVERTVAFLRANL